MLIDRQYLPAQQASQKTPELVLIHGWGIGAQIWAPCLPLLQQHCHVTLLSLPGFDGREEWPAEQWQAEHIDTLVEHLLAQLPEQFIVMGFSLGGMLAAHMALRSSRVQALITVASNQRFVATEDWPNAMPTEDYQAFNALVQQAPAAAIKRFMGLQAKGAQEEKLLLKQLRSLAAEDSTANSTLAASLSLLAGLDQQSLFEQLSLPSLHIFGRHDQLVPVAVASELQQPSQSVVIIEGASHVPFISHSHDVAQRVDDFLVQEHLLPAACGSQYRAQQLKKQAVARSFSRAASTYDSVAQLQRDVGNRLLPLLPKKPEDPVLDLGCGTGYFLPMISQATQCQQLLALDLAEGMLTYARAHHGHERLQWLCGDAENIPLADDSVAVIFSSLAIQWCENLEALFAEIARILKPGGCFVFSTLGPNTLCELRQAWGAVDDYVHVNRFAERHRVDEAIHQAGFKEVQLEQETLTLHYDTLKELTRELKSLGAHNVNAGRPEGLMGKQRIKQFKAAYEAQRNAEGKLPATYQLWYGAIYKDQVQHNG